MSIVEDNTPLAADVDDDELRRRAHDNNPRLVRDKADWSTNMKRMEAAYRGLLD